MPEPPDPAARRGRGPRARRGILAAAIALGVAAALAAIGALGAGGSAEPAGSPTRSGSGEAGSPPRGERGPLWEDEGFPIARMRSGERVALHRRPRGEVVERVGARSELGSVRVFGVTARRGGWLRVTTEIAPDDGDLWVRADRRKMRFQTTAISVHVDLGERRVEVRDGDRAVQSFTVSIGAPDSATPTGRFAVTDLIVGGLEPVYGCCAVALNARQRNLPPGWIGGDRVAFHGTSGQVGLASSLGCLRASNDDMRELIANVPLGSPVFVEG